MKKKINRVCMPCSMYCLTFYLLMTPKDEILNTFFFMAPTIPSNLRKKFKYYTYLDFDNSIFFKNKYLLSLYMLIKRKVSWKFLFSSEIYGLDFYWFLLRGLKMNYIEDAPFVFDIWETSTLYKNWQAYKKENIIKRTAKKIIFGEYYLNYVGTSSGVKKIFASSPVSKSYYENKQIEIVNLRDAWYNSDQEKKNYILSVFDINNNDLYQMKSRDTIILTQPMYADSIMSKEEQIDVYRQMIKKYGEHNCIIKSHPRDLIDYQSIFPDTLCFNKAIPMQLFAIMGISFKKIATVNSSAALSFGKDANIDWWAEVLDYPRITDSGVKTLKEAKELFK